MNKKIYLLLPFCLTLLPACSSSYTLTLINSDPECGTIITEGGKFKAGEQVRIEVETVQGYKVDKWTDSFSGKVGSRAEFNFMMPNRDAELTVTYKYDDFTLNFKQNVTADEDHYDFKEFLTEYGTEYSLGYFEYGDDNWSNTNSSEEFAWKDIVNITYKSSSYYYTLDNITDENGTVLGSNSCSYEMPNYDTSITFNYISTCSAACVTTNIEGIYFSIYENGFSWGYGKYNFKPDSNSSREVSFEYSSYNSEKYVFDYWYDLDTNEILTYEKKLTIETFKGFHRYEAHVHEA